MLESDRDAPQSPCFINILVSDMVGTYILFDTFHSLHAFHKSYCKSDLGAATGITLQNYSV